MGIESDILARQTSIKTWSFID